MSITKSPVLDMRAHGMLVNVHLGIWTGSKQDRNVADDVAQRHGEKAGTVNVIKYVVPKEIIKPVETARNAIRNHKDQRTLPWSDNGDRLLPRKMFQLFMDEHTPLEETFYASVDTAVRAYAVLREKAQFNRSTLFNPEDYPHPEDVRRKFYCKVDISPLSLAEDFRVNLSDDAVTIIKQQIEEATMERIFAAQGSVWERIEKVVMTFAGRMEAQLEDVPEGQRRPSLHQSTINNLIDLVNTLPALNIMNDPNMRSVGRKLHTMLQTYNDADAMKGKVNVCAAAHEEVQAILEELGQYAKAFTA